jgi:SAM-dependent methyltransferase/uncharacterized protein YbaR (Trm112 family)
MPNWPEMLTCPRDCQPLELDKSVLRCAGNHQYPIVDGIPVMLLDEVPQTIDVARRTLVAASGPTAYDGDPYYTETLGLNQQEKLGIREKLRTGAYSVDPVVQYLVGATSGRLYRYLIGNLDVYPIPELPLPHGSGKLFLDIGCSWGRWCIAAARIGYTTVGIDPSLGAVLAARRLADKLGVPANFVVGDARYLPFQTRSFDVVFSYSVFQHFSKADAKLALGEVNRVLMGQGTSLIQMPNAFGVHNIWTCMRRGLRKPHGFEVRYWSPAELKEAFGQAVGETSLFVDGYFGLGIQASDIHLLQSHFRAVVILSEFLRSLSKKWRWMCLFADSLYILSTSRKQMFAE